jgi:hypothetical protein
LKLLTSIRTELGSFGPAFEGRILAPGSEIPTDELPDPAVILECAGAVWGADRRRKETLWVLWKYDWQAEEWRELARAQAVNWEWILVLKGPAQEALHPTAGLVDLLKAGRELAEQIVEGIELKLEGQPRDLRKSVLSCVYQEVAGRIIDAA